MDQKIIVGAVLAVIAISAIIFVLYQQQEQQDPFQEYEPPFDDLGVAEGNFNPTGPEQTLDECGTQDNQYDRDFCWKFEAFAELNASKCLNIEENSEKIICIRAIARDIGITVEDKVAICDAFLSNDEPQRYLCYTEVAREMVDYGVCESMPSAPNDYRQTCIEAVDLENTFPEEDVFPE